MAEIANTPRPPYYAVIFTSQRTDNGEGYVEMNDDLLALAAEQAGFLGLESARQAIGITVSYWADLDSIKKWKANLDHIEAQKSGRTLWYSEYKVRVSKVERDYGF